MPILDCSVVGCIHNADNYCCKGTILVEGTQAKTTEGTFCASFYEKSEDSFRNQFETPDYSLQVDCEAVKCTFNKEKECHAEHIGIAGRNARNSEETECSSFEMFS
ncbi:MAG: DUF1540 domain-containing protein [Clostridiales bacterium]|nr:DUF1540 domain-containing protein [Clostridiales bacterium]